VVVNNTKIVCTIGPACEDDSVLRALLQAGMAVARLNFSHGSHEWHSRIVGKLRQLAEEEGAVLAILQDLCGPKVRIGKFAENKVFLTPGQRFRLTIDESPGDKQRVGVPFDGFVELSRGLDRLLLADGMIELKVLQADSAGVDTVVQVGGWLASNQGLSFPGQQLPLAPLTQKDQLDLQLGMELDVDFVALSFVRSYRDVLQLKQLLSSGGSKAQVIAKLERPEALDDLDAVLAASDGVMVARGDLGIELSPEKVPLAQKRIIREAQSAGKYVITATQMLESMVRSAWPTRAEANDVANAVLDGTDAVMLSAETASGEYPVRAVEMMRRIIVETEGSELSSRNRRRGDRSSAASTTGAVCWAAAEVAEMIGAAAIAAFTHSGATARLIAKTRPLAPIYGITPDPKVLRQINLGRGVRPLLSNQVADFETMAASVERTLIERGAAASGDSVVLVAGFPFGAPWQTNLLRAFRLGGNSAILQHEPEPVG
jgi:pyruvate kinase